MKKMNYEKDNLHIPIRWINFYIYYRLPISFALIAFYFIFSIAEAFNEIINDNSAIGMIIVIINAVTFMMMLRALIYSRKYTRKSYNAFINLHIYEIGYTIVVSLLNISPEYNYDLSSALGTIIAVVIVNSFSMLYFSKRKWLFTIGEHGHNKEQPLKIAETDIIQGENINTAKENFLDFTKSHVLSEQECELVSYFRSFSPTKRQMIMQMLFGVAQETAKEYNSDNQEQKCETR